MRLLFITMLASLGTAMVGLWHPSGVFRVPRLGIQQGQGHCQHCGMNEITHQAHLCAYCYWNLPGSRLEQYIREQ